MGSGLILLVIVGAWLAVLVPMALRSYDLSSSSRHVERFGDAVQVLARRSGRAVSELAQSARERTRATASSPGPAVSGGAPGVRPAQASLRGRAAAAVTAPPPFEPFLRRFRAPSPRPPLTLVQRRQRVLAALLGLGVLSLAGAVLTVWLLVPAALWLGLAAAYVVHLHRRVVRRAERAMRAAGRPASRTSVAPAVTSEPVAASAARSTAPLPAGSREWSPVPVPPPVYVGKPVAPPRPPRVLDLPETASWSHSVRAAERSEVEDVDLDEILDGRRAVGGW